MILQTPPGAHLAALGTAFPRNAVGPEVCADGLCALFPAEEPAFIRRLVENSGIENRYLVPDVAQVLAPAGFTQRNEAYREAAAGLALEAAEQALARSGREPAEVDVLIDVSCTGITIPALDVLLAPRLGLRHDVRRIPITESGCAAGALATGLAASFAQAGLVVLVVAVELCSTTLIHGDRSRTNLIASALFGDGAAAALLVPGGPGPRIAAVGSHLIPGSQAAMGFDVGEHGLRIRLQKELPAILREHLPGAVDDFLKAHGREREDIGLHLVHPGGRRILDAYEQLFGTPPDGLRYSREALRRYGNLSSASILTVLDLALEDGVQLAEGSEVLTVGVGPGLSLEFMILDWGAAG